MRSAESDCASLIAAGTERVTFIFWVTNAVNSSGSAARVIVGFGQNELVGEREKYCGDGIDFFVFHRAEDHCNPVVGVFGFDVFA
jgi:hypothetical protein